MCSKWYITPALVQKICCVQIKIGPVLASLVHNTDAFVFFSCSLNLELGFDFVSSVVA
jgi:hypothetical protein